MNAQIGDTSIFYRVVGDEAKYPLILLHGGPGLDHMEMFPWHDSLADVFYLVYVDLRGQGRSQRVDPATLSLELFARDVTDLARSIGLPRYALLGHSFGSFVTLTHAIEQGGASHYVISGGTASFSKTNAELEQNLATFEPVELREQVTASWAMESTVSTQEEAKKLMDMQWPLHFANAQSMEKAFRYTEEMRPGWQDEVIYTPEVLAYFAANEYAIEIEDRLSSIHRPALLITGQYDRTCTPRASREMHERIPNSDLAIISNAGHQTFMEQPELYFAALRAFFVRHQSQVT
ncbi:MAG: alpha/beta fold hydrolase [Chloroflexota bacterium]